MNFFPEFSQFSRQPIKQQAPMQFPQQAPMQFQQPGMMPNMPAQQFPTVPIPITPAPTGMPTGPSYAPPVTVTPPEVQEAAVSAPPLTVANKQYTQGFLRSMIGRSVKVEFLIGTNMLVDREGTLVDVGISYILIREAETDDLVLCDMYSIKFVKFYF